VRSIGVWTGRWLKDPEGPEEIAATFREACDVAADQGERLAAEGEICWGGMHSWKRMVQLLEMTDRPKSSASGDNGTHALYTSATTLLRAAFCQRTD